MTVWFVPPWLKVTVFVPVVMSTIPAAWCALSAYSAGLIRPRSCPATWSAIATTPANSGLASLVPPMM